MQFSTLTCLFTALLTTTTTALQSNWYSDHNCGQFQNSVFFSGRGIHGNEINGKPAGAGSALFVTKDGDCRVYGCSSPTGGCVELQVGQCYSNPKGTYLSSDC